MTRKTKLLISFVWALGVVIAVHALHLPGSVPHFKEVTGGQVLLDIKPSWTVDEVYNRFESLGEEGRNLYKFRLQTADVLLPLSLFPFLFLAMLYASQRAAVAPPRMQKLLLLFPIVFVVFDFAENISLFLLLQGFPARNDGLATILPYFTVIKRAASIVSLVIPGLLYGVAVLR